MKLIKLALCGFYGLCSCVYDNPPKGNSFYFGVLNVESSSINPDVSAGSTNDAALRDGGSVNRFYDFHDFNEVSQNRHDERGVSVDLGVVSVYADNNNFSVDLLNKPLAINLYSYRNPHSEYTSYQDFDYDNFYYNNEGSPSEPVPLSVFGKVVKDWIWPTEIARPVRELSNKVSSLSDIPTKFIFGKQAKSDLSFKIDSEKLGVFYRAQLNCRWNFGIDYQREFNGHDSDNNETIFIYISAKFRQRR